MTNLTIQKVEITMLKELNTQLEQAQSTLSGLQDELPYYHTLLTEAQQKEVALQKAFRGGSGSFSDLTQAKTATMTAKELLEQHQAEIATAQAEVGRLQAAIQQAVQKAALQRTYKGASEAYTEAQEAWEGKVNELITTLQQQAGDLYRLEANAQEAHRALASACYPLGIQAPLAPSFNLKPQLQRLGVQVSHLLGGASKFAVLPGKQYFSITLHPELPDQVSRG